MFVFLYDWLPAGLFQLLLVIGIIGSLISAVVPSIPFVGAYQALFKIISIVCLCLGLVWFGIGQSEEKWAKKNAAADARITQLEARAPLITTKIVTEYKDKIRYITIEGARIVKEVPVYITPESDRNCPVPAGFVRLLNDSANTTVPGTSGGIDDKSKQTNPASDTSTKPQ